MQQFLIILLSSKAMHKSRDGHSFIQYEKYLFLFAHEILHYECFLRAVRRLLIMYVDTNLSTTLISLYILTSSMT